MYHINNLNMLQKIFANKISAQIHNSAINAKDSEVLDMDRTVFQNRTFNKKPIICGISKCGNNKEACQ